MSHADEADVADAADGADEVVALEVSLLRPEVRRDAARVQALLHPDWREFGASGRVWDRTTTVLELAGEPDGPAAEAEVSHVVTRTLGADAVLLTYRVRRLGRTSLRSSVWVRESGRWQMLFHQGTVSEETGPE